MPRGFPDDNIQTNPLGQTIADNAELAARLGAVTVIQRSGNVIYSTKFSEGLADWRLISGVGGTANVMANFGLVGPTSLNLNPGIAPLGAIAAHKYMPMIDAASMGLEANVCFATGVPVPAPSLIIQVTIDWHAKEYRYMVVIKAGTQELEVHSYSPAHVDTPYTIPIPYSILATIAQPGWHYFKLSVSPDKETYLRMLFDDLAVDLTPYSPDIYFLAVENFIEVSYTYTHVADNQPIYIGSTVLTINEPE